MSFFQRLTHKLSLGLLAFLALSLTAITVNSASPESEVPAAAQTPSAPGVAAESKIEAVAPKSEAKRDEDGGIARESALDDLKLQREEIAQLRRDLETREAELKARESALNDELKKIENLRAEIIGVTDGQKKELEDRVAKVVETLESMSPKPGAALLASVDDRLAVSAASRLSTQKLAKLMNVMEPAKAARLTEGLAGVVRARSVASANSPNTASTDAAATSGAPAMSAGKKGGK